ncbi:hypothetical protein C4D60_Mb01t15370 [Musa balbisiana]|uniref:glutamine--tRNA ligase n=1 Tax=Musa balbisiana TaxID=52838 RepID=A0A4S8JMN3_MUSBA|nr:hypothetical protein C4D60_Mb01t15370 [Musa balbisiana]
MAVGDGDAKPLDLFLSIGLDRRTAESVVVNQRVTSNLTAVIKEAGVNGCSKTIGNLLYMVATKFPANALIHRPTLVQYIVSSKIKNPAQLDVALLFVGAFGPESFSLDEFEQACGVGVDVSVEEIHSTVAAVLEENMDAILEHRYHINVGNLCGQVRKQQPWANAKIVKEVIDEKLHRILGERTAEDDKKPLKKQQQKIVKIEEQTDGTITPVLTLEEEVNPFLIFPEPAENYKVHTEIFFSNGDIWRAHNTKEKLERHLKVTGGRVFTRFPPEPNGYLHIGHAKALFINFGLTEERGGSCYLRPLNHDDSYLSFCLLDLKIPTLTSKKENTLIISKKTSNGWVGSLSRSRMFEVKEYREKKMNSPWRDRPIAESLKLFEDMRQGFIDEGKATLRLKQDMQSHNKNMYDLIAYRIKFTAHPQVGEKWCIYPSYDYSHCIVDSLENITHSLCSLEFEIRRPSYYWLLLALELYQPYVWEYSRLNVSNTMMSKRKGTERYTRVYQVVRLKKLNRLVMEKWVDGWDDPRLMTLAGLRRRGVSSTAINSFIRGLGITRSGNSMIRVDHLEHHIREELNKTAPRTMVVLRPLKVVITNLDSGLIMNLDVKMWPDASSDDVSSNYKVPISVGKWTRRVDTSILGIGWFHLQVLFILNNQIFALMIQKTTTGLRLVNLFSSGKYAFPIKCTEVIHGDSDTIFEIHAEYDPSKKIKPKGVLHWVAQPSPGVDPLKVEVRLFEKLFLSEDPAELEDWLSDLNPHSKEVIPEAYAVPSLANAVLGDKFQFERLGYFAVDPDSTPSKLVFNRTTTLRDSYSKGARK